MKKKRAKKTVKTKKIKRPVKKVKARNNGKKISKKNKGIFRKLILRKKEEILEGINHIAEDTLKKSQKEASGDISGYTYHMADVATDTYDREFSLGLASNDRKVLYELDDALKKIEEGTFGICEECKNAISNNRLKAVPFARFCVKCQERKERR